MTLSTRIGVMNAGKIVQVGEPPEIYEHPNSRFVADFIGSVNMFEGRVTEDEPDFIRLEAPDLGGTIYVGHGVSCTIDQKLWYAIRPEKMRLSKERPDQAENVFSAVVDEIAYMGNLSIHRLKLPSGRMISATIANLSRHAEDAITWGDEVWISWEDNAGSVLTQ